MLAFLSENWATLLMCLVLRVEVVLVVRKIVHDKKKGSCCSCGCQSCAHAGCCHAHSENVEHR